MIIVSLSGGLGNQMFQYALGRFLSLKNNVPLKLDVDVLHNRTPGQGTFREYDMDIFNVEASFVNRSEIPLQFRSYLWGKPRLLINKIKKHYLPNPGREKKFGGFYPDVLSLGPNTYLEGHWQNENYFLEIADIIRKDFTLKDPLPENIQKLKKEIERKNAVCVHVRRTDYVGHASMDVTHQDYYDRSLEYINQKDPIETVYVFSDDIEWCKKHLKFKFTTFFVDLEYSGHKNGGNLVLMSACRHFVIPNSSFSWWGAWLNTGRNKIVVAPKQWFIGQTPETDNIACRSWIRM